MKGISEEELRRLRDHYFSLGINPVIDINNLIEQCKEINPWIPIDENTPKDKRLNLYWPGIGWITGSWIQLNNTIGYFTHDLSRYDPPSVKPTHYQKLPDDPEDFIC